MFGFLKRRRPAPLPVQALAAIVDQDPAPEYSVLDRADGLPRRVPGATLTPAERLAFDAELERLAAPLAAVDTGLLGSLLADADARAKGFTSSLAAEVMVTPDGGLVHGDLTGGAR